MDKVTQNLWKESYHNIFCPRSLGSSWLWGSNSCLLSSQAGFKSCHWKGLFQIGMIIKLPLSSTYPNTVPWMTSTDGTFINEWGSSIHGWNLHTSDFWWKLYVINGWWSVIRGCHPRMEKYHQWMEKYHQWMEKCHPWISLKYTVNVKL